MKQNLCLIVLLLLLGSCSVSLSDADVQRDQRESMVTERAGMYDRRPPESRQTLH